MVVYFLKDNTSNKTTTMSIDHIYDKHGIMRRYCGNCKQGICKAIARETSTQMCQNQSFFNTSAPSLSWTFFTWRQSLDTMDSLIQSVGHGYELYPFLIQSRQYKSVPDANCDLCDWFCKLFQFLSPTLLVLIFLLVEVRFGHQNDVNSIELSPRLILLYKLLRNHYFIVQTITN